MADGCRAMVAEVVDSERRTLDADAHSGDTAALASPPGVAFVDLPTSVLEISSVEEHADDDDEEKKGEEEKDELPYPEYVEKAFLYFLQTTRPRNWCLQLITWPYPFCA